ncbi:hypothetical protein F5880DRAFT_1584826 [Lentinula raphanica]|nr:hypothetical protein F5880DRAFT_1584826 [Lentinula raphanica]
MVSVVERRRMVNWILLDHHSLFLSVLHLFSVFSSSSPSQWLSSHTSHPEPPYGAAFGLEINIINLDDVRIVHGDEERSNKELAMVVVDVLFRTLEMMEKVAQMKQGGL